eukprot:superscaffoldBa00003048_g15974
MITHLEISSQAGSREDGMTGTVVLMRLPISSSAGLYPLARGVARCSRQDISSGNVFTCYMGDGISERLCFLCQMWKVFAKVIYHPQESSDSAHISWLFHVGDSLQFIRICPDPRLIYNLPQKLDTVF